jgi:hypothetical protein
LAGTFTLLVKQAYKRTSLGAGRPIAVENVSTLQWGDGNSQDISARLSLHAGADVTLDVGGTTVVFGTSIANEAGASASLAKAGSGVLSLTGAERFNGITVEDGTIEVRGEDCGGPGLTDSWRE